jgi:hypothetical protein
MKLASRSIVAVALATLWTGSAQAVVACDPGDVTLGLDGLSNPIPADLCYQGDGNNLDLGWLNAQGDPIADPAYPWVMLAKDEAEPGGSDESFSLGGLSFSVTGAVEGSSGVWTLSWTPAAEGVGTVIDLTVVLKASNTWYGYLLENESLDASGSRDGTWEVTFLNGGGQIPDLSYLAVLGRPAEGGIPPAAIPLPASVLLLGSAIAGLGTIGRRRRS